MLPPGWDKLATSRVPTGLLVTQTMGTVFVARCAVRVIKVPGVTRTSTLRASSSAMRAEIWSAFPSA